MTGIFVHSYGELVQTFALRETTDRGTVCVVKVAHGDDTIGVATETLHQFDPASFNEDGNLVCDTAGEYVYRPVHFAEQGRVVVCERVR